MKFQGTLYSYFSLFIYIIYLSVNFLKINATLYNILLQCFENTMYTIWTTFTRVGTRVLKKAFGGPLYTCNCYRNLTCKYVYILNRRCNNKIEITNYLLVIFNRSIDMQIDLYNSSTMLDIKIVCHLNI